MKILADACAWSLLMRRRDTTLLNAEEQLILTSIIAAIEEGLVVIVGPIRQEILSGIKELAQFAKLRTALAAFLDEPISTAHYEEAARLFNLCRSRGVECGSTDILLCAVAVERKWRILTYDPGLKRCIDVLGAEGISL